MDPMPSGSECRRCVVPSRLFPSLSRPPQGPTIIKSARPQPDSTNSQDGNPVSVVYGYSYFPSISMSVSIPASVGMTTSRPAPTLSTLIQPPIQPGLAEQLLFQLARTNVPLAGIVSRLSKQSDFDTIVVLNRFVTPFPPTT